MQHFIQRKYPLLFLDGFHSFENFTDLCSDKVGESFTPANNPQFFDQIKELVKFDETPNIEIV